MSVVMEGADFSAALLEWVNRRLARPGVWIGPDARLFEERLIDSIRILELIAWVERAVDREIPDRMIRMDNFRTVDRITHVFAAEGVHVDA